MSKKNSEPTPKNTLGMDVSVDCVVFGFDNDTLKVLLIEQKQPDTIHLKTQKAVPGDLVLDN